MRISRAKIKFVQSLKHKKYRLKYGSYVLEGKKACETVLDAGFKPVLVVSLNQERLSDKFQEIKSYQADQIAMASLSGLKTPPEMLCVFDIPEAHSIERLSIDSELILFLDRIQDPGNLGTIIRTADWYGVRTIFLNEGCADIYNAKTLQAAMGSHVNHRFIRVEIADIRDHLPDAIIIGLDMNGRTLLQNVSKAPLTILAVGNEGQGLSSEVKEKANFLVRIPGHENRIAESLNAATATAIGLDRMLSG